MSNASKCQNFMEDDCENQFIVEEKQVVEHSWVISLDSFVESVERVREKLSSIEITNYATLQQALDFSSEVITLKERIEAYRKSATKPHRQVIQKVNDYAKELTDTLDRIKAGITMRLSEWQLNQELISIAAKEEAEKISESLGINIDIIVPDAPQKMSSEKASTAIREKLSFEIVDPDKVPDEYWVIDEKLLQRHIDLGKKEIPGIKITSQKNLIIRRRA